MNIVEIKALKAGSGKTVTLVKLFGKTNLKNKIILTPSNKARQGCIQKLCKEYSMEYDKASEMVKTLRSFKRNYVQVKLSEEDDNETYVTIESKDHITYNPWNIFIDEASMISDFEMQDLVKHWRIQNLILDGDCLQFEPIGGKQAILAPNGEVKKTEEGELLYSEDEGSLYNLPIDYQVILTAQYRGLYDEKGNLKKESADLFTAVDLIKKGKIMSALALILNEHPPIDCKINPDSDQHIAYTNSKCDHLNKMYKNNIRRWIVDRDDKMHGFFTSEIINEDDPRFLKLENDLMYESLQNPDKKIPDLKQWKERHLKPAYAITCHKLQGATIENGDIFIHIDDILLGLKEAVPDEKERAKVFQKFLYIAVSRAVSINQINIYGLGMDIDSLIHYQRSKDTKGAIEFEEKVTECCTEFLKMSELCEEMIDPTLKENAARFAGKDENLIKYLESVLDYKVTEDKMYLEWKKEHYESEEYSKAHSKPYKYSDEYLKTFNSLSDLRKVTKNQKTINRWKDLQK